MRSCGRFCVKSLHCLRRCLNAFAVGELLFFAGPKKSNQKKGPFAQEHTFRSVGSRGFSDSPSMARPKTARVLRAALRVLMDKAIQGLLAARVAAARKRWSPTVAACKTRFALAVDAKDAYQPN